jgi:hypothetical protein
LAIHPPLAAEGGFALLYGSLNGLLDGAFWGMSLTHLVLAFKAVGLSPIRATLLGAAGDTSRT